MLYSIQIKIEPLGRPKHVSSSHLYHNPDIGESVTTGAFRLKTAGYDCRLITERITVA